ncbi:DUF1641 domain-containing protein [Terriglobus sp. TAA 43]|uniref:DUF1641 domain-containing protein n=1 Tax=Terriglobus sp. TAA 43 TaxID=278961 RepID=UPI00064561F9|nr:DUF1641 domain-containing protein [Terriglobus sp. TAA 43]
MAKAVEFRHFKPANSRDDLIRRIEAAPQEHADAILEAYDLLESLHEKGILSALNGALRASDTVIEKVTDVVSSKEAVNAVRIGLLLGNLLSAVEVDRVHTLLTSPEKKAPSLISLVGTMNNEDVRRGMSVGLSLLGVFGAALARTEK